MIAKAVGQLLLAVSLFHVAPFDASVLEARVDADRPPLEVAHLVLSPSIGTPRLPRSEDKEIPPPKKKNAESFGVVTSADSVIVVDEASGETLYAEAPDTKRPMGSITKLMTVLVFLDTKPTLSDSVSLLSEDYVSGGRVYLQFDDPLPLSSVLGASLVGSDNTATNALPRLSGLTEEDFIARMNAKAEELGMTSTHFVDTSGLSPENTSTARDLSVLLKAAKGNTIMTAYMTRENYTVTQRSGFAVTIPSTDVLLSTGLNNGDYEITAGKTGYIPQAGYCLATSVKHDGDSILIVVLGAETIDDRFTDAASLARWSFSTFVWPEL